MFEVNTGEKNIFHDRPKIQKIFNKIHFLWNLEEKSCNFLPYVRTDLMIPIVYPMPHSLPSFLFQRQVFCIFRSLCFIKIKCLYVYAISYQKLLYKYD